MAEKKTLEIAESMTRESGNSGRTFKSALLFAVVGTHKGEFMGIPPTGKSVSFGVIDIIRIAEGKVVEHWGLMDSMAMRQQLGAMPASGAGGS
jgi:hypothetical protein